MGPREVVLLAALVAMAEGFVPPLAGLPAVAGRGAVRSNQLSGCPALNAVGKRPDASMLGLDTAPSPSTARSPPQATKTAEQKEATDVAEIKTLQTALLSKTQEVQEQLKEEQTRTASPSQKTANGNVASEMIKDAIESITVFSQQTPAQMAKAYDNARQELTELARIKNDFMAKIELAGRDSGIRLKTMGEMGVSLLDRLSEVQGNSKANKSSSLPDEVYIPPKNK
eukprot:Tamp_22034.p1 GENE.Tamp_22034~~Tamp_22034.p1  ORF type:complete len:227 (-),score=41.32 Tamp_22034:429-1109(-)